MAASAPDALTLSVLDPDEQTAEKSTLGDFRGNGALVIDFWTTRCVNCPAALTKLDAIAGKSTAVYAACALSLGSDTEGTQEQVLELLEGQ